MRVDKALSRRSILLSGRALCVIPLHRYQKRDGESHRCAAPPEAQTARFRGSIRAPESGISLEIVCQKIPRSFPSA